MTSHKDYEAVASIIDSRRNEAEFAVEGEDIVFDIANDLATYFFQDNGRFDRDRFLEACGYTDDHFQRLVRHHA